MSKVKSKSKIKVGSTVKVIASNEDLLDEGCNTNIQPKSNYTVTQSYDNDFRLNDFDDGLISKHLVELVAPEDKWSIYNNTLPWSDLSDKQKGKMLLAAHGKVLFKIKDGIILNKVRFIANETTYQAVEPEPTMAELLAIDIKDSSGFLTTDDINDLMTKGWVKK
jgi:hypothetical protein